MPSSRATSVRDPELVTSCIHPCTVKQIPLMLFISSGRSRCVCVCVCVCAWVTREGEEEGGRRVWVGCGKGRGEDSDGEMRVEGSRIENGEEAKNWAKK